MEQESPETDLHVIWSVAPFQQRYKGISEIKEQLDISVQKYEPRPIFGEGNGTPLQYFCLENPMDGGAW